jgi:hypothetical protein
VTASLGPKGPLQERFQQAIQEIQAKTIQLGITSHQYWSNLGNRHQATGRTRLLIQDR